MAHIVLVDMSKGPRGVHDVLEHQSYVVLGNLLKVTEVSQVHCFYQAVDVVGE